MESSLRVHFLSDSMLKRLDSTFRYIGYSNYEGIIPAPGCEIEKICDLTTRYCHESELIVACFGINNLLNGCSVKHCMYLFEKAYVHIQNHCPLANVAFISITDIAENKFTGCDDSFEMNPLIDLLNTELKTFCHTKRNTHFIDIRQALNSDIDGATVDRDNLGYDGLHFSRKGIKLVAESLKANVEKIKHVIVNASDSATAVTLDLNTEDIWPKLPAAALKNRVYPAMYPGQQFYEIRINPGGSNRNESDPLEIKAEHVSDHSPKPNVRANPVTNLKKPCHRKFTMPTVKPHRAYKRKVATCQTSPRTRELYKVDSIPTRNRFSVLEVDSVLEVASSVDHDGCDGKSEDVISKNHKKQRKNTKRKTKMPYKLTHYAFENENILPKTTEQSTYHNPHRVSPFENLVFKRTAFVQTSDDSNLGSRQNVNKIKLTFHNVPRLLETLNLRASDPDVITLLHSYGINTVYTEDTCFTKIAHGKESIITGSVKDCLFKKTISENDLKSKTGSVEQSLESSNFYSECKVDMKCEKNLLHLEQILLLGGDIELNPGPRMKRQSSLTKSRKKKEKLNEEIETSEISEKRKQRLDTKAISMKCNRSSETPQEKRQRLDTVATSMARTRASETPQKNRQRLNTVATSMARTRASETLEKRQNRLVKDKNKTTISRASETPEKRQNRLVTDKNKTTISRASETPEKRQNRLVKDKNKTTISRASETSEENIQRHISVAKRMQILRNKRRNIVLQTDDVINLFHTKIRRAADYVCCCCNRLMYESGVILFNDKKYSADLMIKMSEFRVVSVNNSEWICRNCHINLKREKIPLQAKCNALSLCKVPDELKDLNSLEIRLISRRIPFMKLVSLPRGRQIGIQGPAVNVPTDLNVVCEQFPRLPSECHIISLKLKRKLEYRKAYLHDYVRPEKVMQALKWLKQNNPLYKDIRINANWSQDCSDNEPELWRAMTNSNSDKHLQIEENTPSSSTDNSNILSGDKHKNPGESFMEIDNNEDITPSSSTDNSNVFSGDKHRNAGTSVSFMERDDNEDKTPSTSNDNSNVFSADNDNNASSESYMEKYNNEDNTPSTSTDNSNVFSGDKHKNAGTSVSFMEIDDNEDKTPSTSNVNSNICSADYHNNASSESCMEIDNNNSDSYDSALERLKTVSSRRGYSIHDVPADGDCQFSAICHELKKHNLFDGDSSTLRAKLSTFIKYNPICQNYKEFVTGRLEQNNIFQADTAQPDERDIAIELLDDEQLIQQQRWELYLHRLEHERQWGDNITIQGFVELFKINIEVISSESTYISKHQPVTGETVADIHLGLIMQYHYVALDKNFEISDKNVDISGTKRKSVKRKSTKNKPATDNQHSDKGPSKATDKRPPKATDDMNSDELLYEAEEKAALDKRVELCGLPYESGLFNKDLDWTNKVISCAPGEKSKPIPLLNDQHFEQLSNPEKFPDGKNALLSEREKSIHPRRYFNQRLLDVDGRFAKSVDYLLSAQYATENQQIQSNINHYIFRRAKARSNDNRKLRAQDVKDANSLRELVKTDQAYKLFKNVRGSITYWQCLYYDILAMMGRLGTPTWFFTISAADMQWPDLIQTIARQYGVTLTDEDVKNLSYADRCNWLRQNPVTAVRHFSYRLDSFLKHVILSSANPLGEVVDYVIRIEFQARGSPHAHTLLWVKNAPQIDVQTDKEVCDFVANHISCNIPEDAVEKEMVLKVQKHSHSSYCRKKGSCRFNYPKPPSDHVIIAREPKGDDTLQQKTDAKDIMSRVYNAMAENGEIETCTTTAQYLKSINVPVKDYYKALAVAIRGRKIVLPRKPSSCCINPYNKTCLLAWQANMDIQFVEDPHACIMYIAAYISKDERNMGELLKQTSKECGDMEIRSKLRKLGSVFLNNREVSAQEAAMRILSIPMKRLSRTITFINTDSLSNRTVILKPKAVLEKMDDDDEDIFQKNINIRYAVRPTKLETMCLAEFAANYSVGKRKDGDNDEDHIANVIGNDDSGDDNDDAIDLNELPKKIYLRDGSGTMTRRRKEAVIRFRKFNIEKEKEDFCRAKLMLFLPWRDENRDLIKQYENYAEHYNAVIDDIVAQESKFTANLASIYQAMDIMEHGPPEHAWDAIAPENQHNELIDRADGVELERPMAQEDLDANEALIMRPNGESRDIVLKLDIQSEQNALSPSEYRSMIRNLNKKQRQIVMYNRKWCKNAVKAWKCNEEISPYRIFLSGCGGVGKSHVIKIIKSDMKKILSLSNRVKPTDATVLVTAPTGVAAFNVDGMTIHSALLLRVTGQQSAGTSLTFDKLNTLRSKLENLTLMVIDEISMVGSDMLLNIHNRLNEIKGMSGKDIWFGNVCILACGDLYQLPPVLQSCIFNPVRDPLAKMHGSGSIFMDEFLLHELTEIMRQKDDVLFANMLGRIRTGSWDANDTAMLQSTVVSETDPHYPKDALHVFAFNKDVNAHNMKKLNELAPEKEHIVIVATDDKYDSTGAIDMSKLPASKSRTDTGGLETELRLVLGARVMMTVNVDTADGLVNGVMGTVKAIEKRDNGHVHTILVQFDDPNVGKVAKRTSKFKDNFKNCVPVQRHKGQYQKQNKAGAQINRTQFPLTLAWAVTIHKCQGLTLEKIVVDMKGGRPFNKGQAYVAFSRVKSKQGLFIMNFNENSIKTDPAVTYIMNKLRTKQLPVLGSPEFCHSKSSTSIVLGHLNIHYFLEKQKDLINEYKTYKNINVICFSETYLQESHDISIFLEKFQYTAYRKDATTVGNQHGIMICVSSQLISQKLPIKQMKYIEACATCISLPSGKLTICTVYMSPSLSEKSKVEDITRLLAQLPNDSPSIIMGDFNVDLLKSNKNLLTSELENQAFIQLVSEPTTDYCSILDHVYFNDKHNIHIDILDTYFSDHDLVTATINF